jgi:LDH2 family malate/lactate/ureidoglycolate dehydrogenase
MTEYLRYPIPALQEYVTRFFVQLGVPPADAGIAADVLVAADVRGVESHGVIRLNTYYGSRLRKGVMSPVTVISTVNETATTLALDAGNGLGQVAAFHAHEPLPGKSSRKRRGQWDRPQQQPLWDCRVLRHEALPHQMIGISLTNSQPLWLPPMAAPLLGTNRLPWRCLPGKPPLCAGYGNQIVPIGRVTVYKEKGEPIPAGWGVDTRAGDLTAAVLQGRGINPLGGVDVMRGYKGYGLALLWIFFSGVLAGSGFGKSVANPSDPTSASVGISFAAVRIDAFRLLADFQQDMDALITELKTAPRKPGRADLHPR